MASVKKILVCALLATFSLTTIAQGKLYKWVDENGKVHYSDKKPANKRSVQEIEKRSSNSFKAVTQQQAIIPVDKDTVNLMVFSDIQLRLDNSIGRYFFGGDCIASDQIKLDEVRKVHPGLMPSVKEMSQEVDRTVSKLGYQLRRIDNSQLEQVARTSEGVVLEANIKKLNYHVCAQQIRDPNRQHRPADFSVSKFRKARARISVDWTLRPHNSDKALLVTTQGSANQWDDNRYHGAVVTSALSMAVNNLLADPRAAKILTNRKVGKNKSIEKKDAGFFDAIMPNKLRYKERAKFTEGLQAANQMKLIVLEHFLDKGEWPTDIHDIYGFEGGVPDDMNKISLRYGGVITYDADDYYIRLMPSDLKKSHSSVKWLCKTNAEFINPDEDICERE